VLVIWLFGQPQPRSSPTAVNTRNYSDAEKMFCCAEVLKQYKNKDIGTLCAKIFAAVCLVEEGRMPHCTTAGATLAVRAVGKYLCRFFVFKLGVHTGQTYKQTYKRTERWMGRTCDAAY